MADVDRIREMEDAVVALRREAVETLARQEELRSQLAALRVRAGLVEREASRALEHAEERRAHQIVYLELRALGRRDLLQQELAEARRRTVRLLDDAARLDDCVRQARQTAGV
jgi:phage shock protein A